MRRVLGTDLRALLAKAPRAMLAINVLSVPALIAWLWYGHTASLSQALVTWVMGIILVVWSVVAMVTWRSFDSFRPAAHLVDLVFPLTYFVALWYLWEVVRGRRTIDLTD